MDEAARFLAAVGTHQLAALFHLGLVTGLRRGEALALRWLDVDVEERYLYVHQQLAIERNRPVFKPVGAEPGGDRIVTFGPPPPAPWPGPVLPRPSSATGPPTPGARPVWSSRPPAQAAGSTPATSAD